MLSLSELRLLYEAGQVSLEVLSERSGFAVHVILGYAKKNGWTRIDPNSSPWHKYLPVIDMDRIEEGVYTAEPISHIFNEDELQKSALLTAASVAQSHQEELTNLRKVTRKTLDWVVNTQDALPPIHAGASLGEAMAYAKVQGAIVRNLNETVTSVRGVLELERKHYNLADMRIVESAEENDALSSTLANIKTDLETMWKEKSAYTDPIPSPATRNEVDAFVEELKRDNPDT